METTEDDLSAKTKIVLENDAFPFKGLLISDDWKKLEAVEGRTLCSLCKKSRKYFCYTCYVPVPEIKHIVPKVKLPVKIDIIKHAREMDGKSTAVHAAVLAPDDVRIFTYPCIPDYGPHENVVLIFPNKNAVSVEDVCEMFLRKEDAPVSKRPRQDQGQVMVHRAVFIDSTWNQSRGIFKDPRIKGLSSVVLKSRMSQFWRHQADSPRWYLATIEAIHQFLLELDAAHWHLRDRRASDDDSTQQKGQGTSENSPDVTKPKDNASQCSSDNSASWLSTFSEAGTGRVGDGALEEHNRSLEGLKNQENNDNTMVNTREIDSTVFKNSDKIKCRNSDKNEYHYNGQYDNLLFFFRFMYSKIHTLYDHEQLRSYKRRLE